MFSFFNDAIAVPSEIVALGILPQLSIQDLVAFRSVSKHSKALSEDNTALQLRIQSEFGSKTHASNCALKYMIHYFFEKGFHLLCGAFKSDNKKLLQRATQYLSTAKSLINQLGPIDSLNDLDKPWVNFMYGYLLCVQADATTKTKEATKLRVAEGMGKLNLAANAGHKSAKLLLAYIHMRLHSVFTTLFSQNYLMELTLMDNVFYHGNVNISREEGLKHLISAYQLNEQEAAQISHAFLEENETILVETLTLLSEKGIVNCNLLLGELALSFPPDEGRMTQALRFYERASDQGNIEATLALVDLHATGTLRGNKIKTPTPQDTINAIECLKLATRQGSSHAAFHLGTLHLTGSCSLSYTTTLKNVDMKNVDEAIKCFEHGTKNIKDFNFESAGKCAFALAKHYYKKGDLKNAYKWYEKGNALGHFECSIEAGYLCLHHHVELGLLNGSKIAESYFDDAFMLKPATETLTTIPTSPKSPENTIANLFISHDGAEKYKEVNLQQYIKWKFRTFASGYQHAMSDLRDLFQKQGQQFTRVSTLASHSHFGIFISFNEFARPIEKPFNIDICNPKLAQDIHALSSNQNPSLEAISELARRCYQTLSSPVIEDQRLSELMSSDQTKLRRLLQ